MVMFFMAIKFVVEFVVGVLAWVLYDKKVKPAIKARKDKKKELPPPPPTPPLYKMADNFDFISDQKLIEEAEKRVVEEETKKQEEKDFLEWAYEQDPLFSPDDTFAKSILRSRYDQKKADKEYDKKMEESAKRLSESLEKSRTPEDKARFDGYAQSSKRHELEKKMRDAKNRFQAAKSRLQALDSDLKYIPPGSSFYMDRTISRANLLMEMETIRMEMVLVSRELDALPKQKRYTSSDTLSREEYRRLFGEYSDPHKINPPVNRVTTREGTTKRYY